MRLRFSALLMFAALLLAPMPCALAEGGDAVSLSVATVSGTAGESVTVPITILECASVDSLQFNLNYDSAALKVVSVNPGVIFPAEYVISNASESNRVRFACIAPRGLTKGGEMASVTFDVLSDAGSAITLSDVVITAIDASYTQSESYISLTDGGVTVGGKALPNPVATPFIGKTPEPTPSPTPEPTAEPTPAVIDTPEPTLAPETPAPETSDMQRKSLLPILLIVLAAVLVIGVAIIVVTDIRKKKRREARRRKALAAKKRREAQRKDSHDED